MGELFRPINEPPKNIPCADIYARRVAEEMGVGNLFEGCICPERGLTPKVAERLGADLYAKLNELIADVQIFGLSADLMHECILLGIEVETRLSSPDSIPQGVFHAENNSLLNETSLVDFWAIPDVSGNIFTQNNPLHNISDEAKPVFKEDQTLSSINSAVIHWKKRNQNPKLKAQRGPGRHISKPDTDNNISSGSLFPKVPSR